MNENIKLRIAKTSELESLKKLSTEKLIIWIIGKSRELNLTFSVEEIVIESWLINPEKHALRGFPQFPDSNSVAKRIGEMKGKKGLLRGSDMIGYHLTEISKVIYQDLVELIKHKKVIEKKGVKAANRNIFSIDETPYNKLKKTPVYIKVKEKKYNEIVETDFLYFYGINWHSKTSFVQSRLKNIDMIVEEFSKNDPILLEVHTILNEKFQNIKNQLIKK